jgi:predicted nucleotidyltransferase
MMIHERELRRMKQRASVGEREAQDPELQAVRDGHWWREAFRRALIAARRAAGLTQAALAAKVGTTQSAIARLESGAITPTVETLCRLADVLGLYFEIAPRGGLAARPAQQRGLTLEDLRARRDEILQIAEAHGARNVRVFGSVARGEAHIGSDVDVLVDVVADTDGFAYFGLLEDLRRALAELIGREVDVVDSGGLRDRRERVLGEAVPL